MFSVIASSLASSRKTDEKLRCETGKAAIRSRIARELLILEDVIDSISSALWFHCMGTLGALSLGSRAASDMLNEKKRWEPRSEMDIPIKAVSAASE